eukprot:TRINITY_DN696_c0_g1_i2.p1 TRINITY_DN696_c0_g1~~TRINITY_DN696_c0_g1_i2.p1  ORF type:complete len:339 (+),score=56.09 TRINITY_DN696_c0_g1_i2:81-1097(+)
MWGLSNKTKLFSMYFSAQEIEDLDRGIRKRLNSFLLRFDEDLGGVMIEYSNLRRLEQQMHISSNRTPYLHCEVVVDAIIFNPKPGKQLIGQVNHFSNDFLSLLVYGIFNAAITADRMRANFVKTSSKWVNSENKKEQISVGTWVIFEVVQVDRSGSIFGIAGSMLEPSSGPIITSKKKHTKSNIKYQPDFNKLPDQQQVQENGEQKEQLVEKKSKKRKKREGNHDEEKTKKKKKKVVTDKTETNIQNQQESKNHDKNQQQVHENGQLQNGDVIEILDDSDHENDKVQKRKDKKQKKKKNKGKGEKQLSNNKVIDGIQQNIDEEIIANQVKQKKHIKQE